MVTTNDNLRKELKQRSNMFVYNSMQITKQALLIGWFLMEKVTFLFHSFRK